MYVHFFFFFCYTFNMLLYSFKSTLNNCLIITNIVENNIHLFCIQKVKSLTHLCTFLDVWCNFNILLSSFKSILNNCLATAKIYVHFCDSWEVWCNFNILLCSFKSTSNNCLTFTNIVKHLKHLYIYMDSI